MIKLQSLNITYEELITVLYAQKGIQYKYRVLACKGMAESMKLYNEFFDEIKKHGIELECIFEDENNFIDTNFCSKNSWFKKRCDSPITNLRHIRERNIEIKYIIKDSDMDLLRSVSPPLRDWIKGLKK